MNRYAYVRNNPVNLVDPSGYKFSWKKFFHKVAQIATAVAVVATVVAVGALVVGQPEVAVAAFAVARVAAVVAVAATAISAAIPENSSSRGPPSPTPGHAASFLSPVRYTDAGKPLGNPQNPNFEAAKVIVQNLGVSPDAAKVVAKSLTGPQADSTAQSQWQFSVGIGGTIGGSLAPFVLPSVFVSGSANLGVTSNSQLFFQLQGSVLGGVGIFGGFGPQASISYGAKPLRVGRSIAKSLQVQLNLGAGPSVGGAFDLGPEGASVSGSHGRGGFGLGLMSGGGVSGTVTFTSPPISEGFQ